MDCKYSHREEPILDRTYIRCNQTTERCPMVRYCGKVGDIINIDNYERKCRLYIEKENSMGITKETPNKVLFEKRGKLYIETNDEIGQVITLDNPFDEIPKAVKLLKRQNGEYYIFIKKETSQNEKKRN